MHDNKQTVRQLFEHAFNRDAAAIDTLAHADYAPELRKVIELLRGAFPDLRYTIEELVAEDDRVAVRWHWTGTHTGVFRGVAPTRKSVTNSGAGIFRLRDGRIAGASIETDRLGFAQALGVAPGPATLFPAS